MKRSTRRLLLLFAIPAALFVAEFVIGICRLPNVSFVKHVNALGFIVALGVLIAAAVGVLRLLLAQLAALIRGRAYRAILNLGDTIMNRITDNTDSADTPTNGEDLIEGFSVTNQSLTTPGWQIKVDLSELAHNSLLGTLSATITGKTATYSSGGKSYSKKTLYSLVGNTNILGSVIEANINLTMANVSSPGAYSDAWNSGSAYLFYTYDKSEKVLFWTTTYHYIDKRTGTAKSLWNGSYGKNSSNAKYNSASWYTKP